MSVSFRDEIAELEAQREATLERLKQLEKQWDQNNVETQECREAIENLRGTLKRSSKRIAALPVSDESGRPSRGARRDQIEKICRKLGRGGKSFRTSDVLSELSRVEGELSDGIRSYTYAVMNTFLTDGFTNKVGRGTWRLK